MKPQNGSPIKYEDIFMFVHCGKCLQSLPKVMSASEYVLLKVSINNDQIIVWCIRHDELVVAFTLKDPPRGGADHLTDCPVEIGLSKKDQIIVWCKRHNDLVAAFTLKNPPHGMKCAHPNCPCREDTL